MTNDGNLKECLGEKCSENILLNVSTLWKWNAFFGKQSRFFSCFVLAFPENVVTLHCIKGIDNINPL